MPSKDEYPSDLDEDLPQVFVDALKTADRRTTVLTHLVDREIALRAERQFGAREHPAEVAPKRSRSWLAAAAAVVVVSIGLFSVIRVPDGAAPRGLYTDVDQSGRIDIADVMALAKSTSDNAPSQADLDAFALSIVRLKPVRGT